MEFDSRMTNETKEFVAKIAPFYSQLSVDLVRSREILDKRAEEINSNYKIDNVEEREILVKSAFDDYEIPVTVFIPKTVSKSSSIVVFFHGGGFKFFSRKTHRNAVLFLADYSNKIWVSVEYRLSPEHKYPIPVNDCVSVTKWVIENKSKYFNALPDVKVGVCGDSAGGNLAASVALKLKEFLSFQILIYPWLDLTGTSEYYPEFAKPLFLLVEEMIKISGSEYVKNEDEKLSPHVSLIYNNELEGLPNCLFINAELDPLIGDALKYERKLNASNVKTEMYVIKGVVHGLFDAHFNYKNAFLECAIEILKFLNRF